MACFQNIGPHHRKKKKNAVSSLPLEHSRAHMFLGLRFVTHWDSSIHSTSKRLLSTTRCQVPKALAVQERTETKALLSARDFLSARPLVCPHSLRASSEDPGLTFKAASISGHCLLLCQTQMAHLSWAPGHVPPLVFLPTCCFCTSVLSGGLRQGPLSNLEASEAPRKS